MHQLNSCLDLCWLSWDEKFFIPSVPDTVQISSISVLACSPSSWCRWCRGSGPQCSCRLSRCNCWRRRTPSSLSLHWPHSDVTGDNEQLVTWATNHRTVIRSRDLSCPIRGQYSLLCAPDLGHGHQVCDERETSAPRDSRVHCTMSCDHYTSPHPSLSRADSNICRGLPRETNRDKKRHEIGKMFL